MNWHYVDQGKQAGPVTEEQLLALVREGKVSEETLVWREGLPNWIRFHEAGVPTAPAPEQQPPPFLPPPPLNPNETVCVECRKVFPIEETIPYGNKRVCAACKPVFLQKLAEGAKIDATEMDYAGFWVRVGAKIIDLLIVDVPFTVLIFLLIGLLGASSTRGQPPREPDALAIFLVLCLFFGRPLINVGYQTYFLGKYGATLGKMACRLRVVSADGTRFGYGRAVGRAFSEWLSRMTIYIGYILVAFDAQKRALHDHICNTRVIRK